MKPTDLMLCKKLPNTFKFGNGFTYEIKYDGLRVKVVAESNQVKIYTRYGDEITYKYPELLDSFSGSDGIYDVELVNFGKDGKPSFALCMSRFRREGDFKIKLGAKHSPTVAMVFDIIEENGLDLTNCTLMERKDILSRAFKNNSFWKETEMFDDGEKLLEEMMRLKMEGIIVKDKAGRYHKGLRTFDWMKVKRKESAEFIITGYERKKVNISLQVSTFENGEYKFFCNVGSGIPKVEQDRMIVELFDSLTTKREGNVVTLKPYLTCEVEYYPVEGNSFRNPAWKGLRGYFTKADGFVNLS